MIPTIETIVENLLNGTLDKSQAVSWLNQHAADACVSLRDEFAMAALMYPYAQGDDAPVRADKAAAWAYELADCMMSRRAK